MATFVQITGVGTAEQRAAILDEVGSLAFQRQITRSQPAGPRRQWATTTSHSIARLLFAAMQPALGRPVDWPVSDTLRRITPPLDQWRFTRVDPLLRLYRYDRGDSFALHRDEERILGPSSATALTVLFYLPHAGTLIGGETFIGDACVQPTPWSLLVFAHDTWHHGAEVMAGTKTVIRTDVVITCSPARSDGPTDGR